VSAASIKNCWLHWSNARRISLQNISFLRLCETWLRDSHSIDSSFKREGFPPRKFMKTFIQVIAGMVLLVSGTAQQPPLTVPPVAPKPLWSMVYLPSLDWTETEIKQALALLGQIKPDLVVSLAPCPFADSVRNLACKPVLLDQERRIKGGTACGVPPVPLSAYVDTSHFHSIGVPGNANSKFVWLSAEPAKHNFNGPASDEEELRSLARMQIRKQLAERQGEVVLLVDPALPMPTETNWILPVRDARFEQAACGVTGLVCIRPETLWTQLAGTKGLVPRTPLIHWIHSFENVIEWETLPIDGGPAVQRAVSSYTTPRGNQGSGMIAWLKSPKAPSEVPSWMDDYINNNPALGCGDNIRPAPGHRRFGWTEEGVDRDTFDVLRSPDDSAPGVTPDVTALPRGAVRSPGNLFSVTVGQLDEMGMYPEEGDDGINVYLDDLHGKKSRLLYFAGLYSAWPSAATWFTDRYVITTGTCNTYLDFPDESDTSPRFHPTTIHLFDLLTGRSFIANGMPHPGEFDTPTEKIFFPRGTYSQEMQWRTLWKAMEAAYLAKPEQPPISAVDAATSAKMPAESGLRWKDLGIWPPPETWQMVSELDEPVHTYPEEKSVPTGDSYLSCKQTIEGELRYKIAISGFHYQDQFVDRPPEIDAVAHANLLTCGKGSLPQVRTVQRVGENKQFLLISGTYQTPGAMDSENGKWMLLTDLLHHRSWSVHW